MPAELAHPVPDPSVPTPEERWAAIAIEVHCIKLIAKYMEQDEQRTKENDAEALRCVCKHSSSIFTHIEACSVVAAGFAQETRVILYRLALAHREHIANEPPPPPPRKSASRDPRKRLPSPPEPVVATAEPHKDISNDGGVARTHARRAPLVAQPYQRSARPAARKHKKVEDVEDVPEAIAASVRTAQADEHLPMVLGPVSIADLTTPSLDDLCALFGSTSLSAPAACAAEDDPVPAGANRDAYLPTHVPAPTPTPTPAPSPPLAASSSRVVRAKSVPPARMNPLDRSGRRRGKTAQL